MIYFEQGRRLAAMIPGARFVPLEGRNLCPSEIDPGWATFVREVREFLGSATAAPRVTLTTRQIQVLQRVAAGQTDKQIARDLSLSPRTVEMHVAGAMRALGVKTRAEATHRATQQRLLPP
jgi:DNA-binding NarL/FixJ family response regulator